GTAPPGICALSLHDALPISLLATVAIVVGAGMGMQAVDEQNQTLYNRPPQVVNTVLPDAASVARGAALVEAHCAGWDGSAALTRSEEHTSELQSRENLVCRL